MERKMCQNVSPRRERERESRRLLELLTGSRAKRGQGGRCVRGNLVLCCDAIPDGDWPLGAERMGTLLFSRAHSAGTIRTQPPSECLSLEVQEERKEGKEGAIRGSSSSCSQLTNSTRWRASSRPALSLPGSSRSRANFILPKLGPVDTKKKAR